MEDGPVEVHSLLHRVHSGRSAWRPVPHSTANDHFIGAAGGVQVTKGSMRQTNFFQTEVDERALFAFLLEASAPPPARVVLLDPAGSRRIEDVHVYTDPASVPPVGRTGENELLFAALLHPGEEIAYRQVATGPHRGQLRIVQATSPVMEVQRCSTVGQKLLRGRVYAIDRDFDPAEGLDSDGRVLLVRKSQAVTEWVNRVTRWIRERYFRTIPAGPFLIGPDAAAWCRQGGELSECGVRYTVGAPARPS